MTEKTVQFTSLIEALRSDQDREIQILLPNASNVPQHFHVTEIGHTQRNFIDCGGTRRRTEAATLQVWIADDFDHRMKTKKLLGILEKGIELFDSLAIPLEIEFDNGVISQYPVQTLEVTEEGIKLLLTTKHTACLAPDRCGVGLQVLDVCSGPGCC